MGNEKIKEIFRLRDLGRIAPFEVDLIRNPSIEVHGDEGVCFNRIFMKFDMTDKAKSIIMKVCDTIDRETGIVSLHSSETSSLVPLNDDQLAIMTGTTKETVRRIMQEMCGYGMFAKVEVAKTYFYIANPYFVTRGFTANSYLFNIFNGVTLKRIDNEHENFKHINKKLVEDFFEKVE